MAHFAELDENNFVKQVIVINNNELLDEQGNESEAKGVVFCQTLFGGNWVQTSYNAHFRKHFATIGSFYNSELDICSTAQDYPSWILDEETYTWIPPIPKPDSGLWVWNEETVSWQEYEGE